MLTISQVRKMFNGIPVNGTLSSVNCSFLKHKDKESFIFNLINSKNSLKILTLSSQIFFIFGSISWHKICILDW